MSGRRAEAGGWLGDVEGFVGSRRTLGGFPGGPVVRICLAMQEMCVQSLAWELRRHMPRATKPVNHDYGVCPLGLASHSGGSLCKENQRNLRTRKPQQEPKTDPKRERNWDQAASQEGGAWGSRIPRAIASLLGGHSSALGLTFLKSKQSGPRLPALCPGRPSGPRETDMFCSAHV